MRFLDRPGAAAHFTNTGLKTSAQALADMASDGVGPRYAIIRGRAVYKLEDLDAWLEQHFSQPGNTEARSTAAGDTAA